MSRKYNSNSEVPTEVLINRLKELSNAVTEGRSSLEREFTMRIPAECDRDADIVLAESAKRLEMYVKLQHAAKLEMEMHKVGCGANGEIYETTCECLLCKAVQARNERC